MQALVELDFLLIGSCLVSLCNGMVNGAFQIYLSFPSYDGHWKQWYATTYSWDRLLVEQMDLVIVLRDLCRRVKLHLEVSV